jgi:putative ABC transport system permease protein
VQMAFAFCLVIVASTFVVSVRNLFGVDTGFNADHVTVLTLRSELGLNQDALQATQVLQQQVDRLPDVESAAVAWRAIFDGSPRRDAVVVPGKPPSGRQEIFYRVSSGYFATLRTPLLEGRDLTPGDTDATEPVATVVNRAFARAYFGAGPVLGRVFQRADGVRHVVVGLAGDSFYENLRGSAQPIAYFPMKPPRIFSMYVRSARDAVTVMKLVQQQASTLAPGIRIVDVTPLNMLIDGTLVTERLLSSLGSVLAAIGLTLAAIGSFGIVNYTVLQRTTEIGIRAALGASRRALIALVVRDIVRIGAVAIIVGFAAAVGSMILARSQLFGVHVIEPTIVLTAVGIFLVSTTLAICAPVLRAATIDPMIALRAGADQ